MKILVISIIIISLFTMPTAEYFAKGADISWVPGQESRGIVFYDTLGVQRDIFDILKNDYQMNTIRLRVFVNPSDDWGNGLCDIPATVAMGQRTQNYGMRLMLTLHYSDSWADPGKQYKPAAWESYSVQELEQAVANHTTEVMQALADVGVTPDWVQIGNETNDGMLWDDNASVSGRASDNMANYARFINAGHNAVKAVSQETQTIVHLSNGFDNGLYRWNIGGLIDNGANFDIIAMSTYPEYANVSHWSENNNMVIANANDLISRYNKPIMVAEIGTFYTQEDACRDMIADMISQFRALDNQQGLGVLYWEPQAGPGYNRGYDKGAWGQNGRPTRALTGFIEDGVNPPPCTPTAITPHIRVEQQAWNSTSQVTIDSGTSITFGPHPNTEDLWSWSGCGTTGNSREQTVSPQSTCVATATYTNGCGAVSTHEFTITVNNTTSIENFSFIELNTHLITVFPNPSKNGFFEVKLPDGTNESLLIIYDINGKKVYSQKQRGEFLQISSQLSPGVYFIEINIPETKIIKNITVVE